MTQMERMLVEQEKQELVRETASKLSVPSQDQYLRSISPVCKKNAGHILNLKTLNQHISYMYLKMEGLFLLKDFLQKKGQQ